MFQQINSCQHLESEVLKFRELSEQKDLSLETIASNHLHQMKASGCVWKETLDV